MNVPKTIFRQYDVRGLVADELTPELARGLGRAFATAGWERLGRAPAIAVGRDNRPSGEALAAGVRRGIVEAGGTAVDVGTLPTPALYFAVHALGADGGVQVTGSHNPPEFNGFKMVLGGEAFHGEEILELWETIVAERWRSGQGRETSDGSVLARYREGIVTRHRLERPVRVVVDCGNGVGSLIAVPTLEALGAEVTPLFCESDGTFPNHHPDPTVPENLRDLQATVRRTGAELGHRVRRRRGPDRRRRRDRRDHLRRPAAGHPRPRRGAPLRTRDAGDLRREVLGGAAGGAPRGRRGAGHVEDRALADQGQDEGAGRAARGRNERPHVLRRRLSAASTTRSSPPRVCSRS